MGGYVIVPLRTEVPIQDSLATLASVCPLIIICTKWSLYRCITVVTIALHKLLVEVEVEGEGEGEGEEGVVG